MNLKFICAKGFEIADGICAKVQGYLPNLIHHVVEEILHYFRIPEQHDNNCFFHAKKFGEATIEDCWKDFCPKCRTFMSQLKDPLNFDKLFNQVQRIYRFARFA